MSSGGRPFYYLLTRSQVSQIEFSLVEKDVVFGLRQGNEALAQLNREMNTESVERLMEDTAEAVAYQKVRFNASKQVFV